MEGPVRHGRCLVGHVWEARLSAFLADRAAGEDTPKDRKVSV